jgi:serine/threonine-protein kinase
MSAAPPPATKEPLPERFGPYRVIALLGTGGMGRVYLALDEALDREVALKTLLPALAADTEFVARFTREARAAASLNHPNITQIYATGQEGAIPYFAMELIRGRSLESLVRQQGALEARFALSLIRQSAIGLRHAADRGLIHRDVKPSNLMLAGDGVVKITDFGLAKAAGADTGLTATGQVLGSPGYISPEQAQGGTLDRRTDIYSLGASFYHLVAGRLPFQAPTAVAMILKHMNEPLRSPRALNADVPFPVAAIIQKMMAKRPSERFQDYEALIAAIDRALAELAPHGVVDPVGVTVKRAVIDAAPGQAAAGPAPGATPSGAARTLPIAPRGAPRRSPPGLAAGPESDVDPVTARRGVPLLPAVLMIAVAALLAMAAWKKIAGTDDSLVAGSDAPAAAAVTTPTLAAEGSFTTHPASVVGDRPAPGMVGMPSTQGAELVFLENDHESLPQGGLRVHGRVRNSGAAPARLARVRVKVLMSGGQVAAQAETDLRPGSLVPGQIGAFDVTLDYGGPSATIRSEIVWSE